MMDGGLQFINPKGLYDPSPNGYSHIAIAPSHSRTIYIAGQGGETEAEHLSPDFEAQLKQAFSNLRTALSAAQASLQHIVKLTVLVVDHDEVKLQQLAAEVQKIWKDHAPACTLIPVPRLALDGMLFEVDAIAVIPESQS